MVAVFANVTGYIISWTIHSSSTYTIISRLYVFTGIGTSRLSQKFMDFFI